ncbi:MAG: tetratricopeptide repeat protein [bacterium]|nr:tetratricopeptide repeat protein [bacterium]
MRTLLLLFFLTSTFQLFAQERDSFLVDNGYYQKKNWTLRDTGLVYDIIEKAHKLTYTETNRAEDLCRKALAVSNTIESAEGRVRAYLGLSHVKVYQNQNDSAMFYVKRAQPIAHRAKLKKLEVKCLEQEAVVYAYMERFDKSSELCFEAIKLGNKLGEKYTIKSTGTLGFVFMKLGNLERSSDYSQKSLDLAKKYKDTTAMLGSMNILALNLKNDSKPDEALAIFERALKLAKKSDNLQLESQVSYNMSNIFMAHGETEKGMEYFDRSVEISKSSQSYRSTAVNFHALAMNLYSQGKLTDALAAADSAVEYALLSENWEVMTNSFANLAFLCFQNGEFEDAYACMTHAYVYKDSMNLEKLRESAMSSEAQFEEEKRRIQDSLKNVQQELRLENKDKINKERLASRDRLIWIFALAIVLFLIAGYFIIKNNRLIKSQNALVNKQKEEIQLQHTEIRDSIDYAQRIQAAMINKRSEWDKLGTHFIFFRPKDVVSGDFYWAHNKGDLSIWVVADCTGHGVPGAFMSMLGFGFLNEIVIERDCSDASEILNLLRSKIVAALGEQGQNQARDGMDVSICIWNKKTNELQYAGANNPLWIIRHESSETPESVRRTTKLEDSALQLLEIEPDKMPVGFVEGQSQSFTNKSIQLFPGDTIIQLTDGYADQFGGPQGKKMKYAPMKRALIQMQSMQFDQQFEALSNNFDAWRGDLEQVDDVCVVAVRVS